MAEKSEMGEDTRDRVDVPRDGFVGRVVQDPRQPPNALLLTGFVGDSAEEGHLRLYSDPSLAQYVDVPEEAVLHSEPLPMDQSPLGGSHLWVRSDAKLLPQGGGAQQQQAGFLGGQLLQEQLGGAAALGGAGLQITRTWSPWQCWPTRLSPACSWICPTRNPVLCPVDSWICPPQTFGCPDPLGGFQGQPLGGFQAFAAAPQAAQQAVSAQCQMSYGPCPTHMPGCPSTSTCPPTDMFGCPRTSTCPPTYMPGCPSTSTCPPEAAQAFGGAQQGVQQAVSAQCHMSYGPCPSQPLLGCTGWLGCGQGAGGQQQTLATVCTQLGCQTDAFGCPRTSTCPPTYMPGCPSTSTCPPGGEQAFAQAMPGEQAQQAGPGLQLTIATVCTQIGCQSLGIACTYIGGCGCYPMTVGPVVPTHNMPICPPGGGGVVSAGRCPSAVDACPTRLCGGQFGGNPGF
jgi:hypothetical protein